MDKVKGDLIEMAMDGHVDVIAHGCNCFCTMGAGIAKQIREQFPNAFYADSLMTQSGDESKLGTCTYAICPTRYGKVIVVNAYTQYSWKRGPNGEPPVDYDAVRKCFKWIAKHLGHYDIGIPMIGAGLAGGNWDIIEGNITEEMADCTGELTLVEYEPK